MIDKQKLDLLDHQFQRIFIIPVTKSSFRELQNAVMAAMEGNIEKTNNFLQALVTGDASGAKIHDAGLREFIKKFSFPTRIAKEVHDRGEVLGMITSDMGIQGDNVIFSCRLRRIDGAEFHYITEMEGLLHVVEHYVARFEAGAQTDKGRPIAAKYKQRLAKLQQMLAKLVT